MTSIDNEQRFRVITSLKAATDRGMYVLDEEKPEMVALIERAEEVGIPASSARAIISGLAGTYDIGFGETMRVASLGLKINKNGVIHDSDNSTK